MKYLLPIACLLSSICYGQIYFNTTFDIDSVYPEVYTSVIYNPNQNCILVHGNVSGDHRPQMIKFNLEGVVQDSFLIDNDHFGLNYGAGLSGSLIYDNYGHYLAAGVIQHGSGSLTGYITKTNEFGDTLWTYQSDSLGYADGFSAVTISQDTNYVVAGRKESFSNGSQDFWLVKLDTNGNLLWQNNYGGGGRDYASSVDTTIDGGYIMGGYTTSYGAGGSDIYIVKTDADGNFQWHKWFGQSSYDSGFVKSLPNGHFIVYGAFKYENPENLSENAPHAVVMELDENGNQVWFKEYSEYATTSPLYYTHDEGFNSMVVLSDGYLFSGGTDDSLDNTRLGWAVKTDFNGNQLWSRRYRKRNSANYFQDVLALPNGDLVFTGFVWPEGSFSQDGWIVRTNCLGFDGPPEANGAWHNAAANTVIFENDSERFGDGIVYWGDGNSTTFTEFDDTLINHIYATSGNYDITLIVNACSESDTISINADATVTGISEPEQVKFELYPNPAKDIVIIDFNTLQKATGHLTLYSLTGEVVADYQLLSVNQYQLDVSDYPKGTYILRFVSAQGVMSKKLVVQ